MFFGGDPFGGGEIPFGMGGRGPPRGEVDNSELYETLGVAKDADDSTIKKAYRKLALKVSALDLSSCDVMESRDSFSPHVHPLLCVSFSLMTTNELPTAPPGQGRRRAQIQGDYDGVRGPLGPRQAEAI